MSGFEIPGLVLGVAGLLAGAKGAMDAFTILADIFTEDNGLRFLATKYHVEKFKLEVWGEHVKVHDAHNCLLLRESQLVQDAVLRIMAEINATHDATAGLLSSWWIIRTLEERGKIKQKHRISWATKHKDELTKLVEKLDTLNKDLQNIVPSDTIRIVTGVLTGLRKELDLDTLGKTQDAGDGAALLALSAKLKQMQVQDVHMLAQKAKRISGYFTSALTSPTSLANDREIGYYEKNDGALISVWIEWKTIAATNPRKDDIVARILALSSLIVASDSANFRQPTCLGVHEDFDHEERTWGGCRIGFVYELPAGNATGELITLKDMLSRAKKAPRPPLGQRFELARKLASALSLFHATDWIHKSLRSDNIIFTSGHDCDEKAPNLAEPRIAGMNVALKKYREIPGDRASSKRLHKLLWQELKVFCHPYLRLHENVCKLHFIGWDETSLIPALGLEFAIYGTLDDCLQDLRSYHSELTKSHLSLDVALGLEAIHASGLVHGDIKPSNIIVQEHSSRPFVAKVTDFNGVSPAETYGKEYTFGTPEWLSPEVRLQCKGIDWQLADVYSFAMVTTTLWSTFGFIPLGGSFIDPLLEYTFTEEGKRMCIDCMKFEKEPGPESLVTMAISTTQAERMSEYEHFKVMSVIITGLCQRPTERLTMREMLVNSFQTFCAEVNRPLPESDRSLGIISPTEYYSYDGCEHLLVFSSAFSRASSRFQGMFFQGLLEYEKSIRNHDPTFSMLSIQEVEEGFKGDEIDLLEAFNRHDTFCESEYSGNHKIDHFAIVAAELGLSYLAGQGTPVDEKLGIEWLSKAAMAGNVTIASVFGPYEQSTSMMALGNNALPRRSWGVYATMVSGFQPSISCLEKLDPALHGLAVGAYRRKTFGPPILLAEQEQPSSTTVGSKAGPAPEMIEDVASLLCTWAGAGTLDAVKYLLETRNLGAHINTRSMAEFPIFRATLANQFEIAKYLLDMGADVSMISSKGWSLAHCLSFMDDQHAAELAPLYVSGGASLSLEALDEPRSIIGDLDRGYGEPLLWAAIKRKRRLFSVLLQCHIRTGCSLSRSRYGVIVSMLADSHETSLLEMTLKNMSDLSRMEGTMDDAEDVGEFYLELVSGLLTCALDAYAQKILRRRYVHMGNFRNAKMETLSLLLRSGADPTRPGGVQTDEKEQKTQKDALTVAVYTNDCDALRLFIEHLQSRDMEVEPLLRDLGRFEGYTALHQSIYKSSREVFMFVIERFPSLLHIPGKYQDMPLHAAATQQWTGYIHAFYHGTHEEPITRNCQGAGGEL
ncbi:hypothetical protein CcaCcLH18_13073 [Colletotrichum camelliae]|nr:hypothetical protein CcaCcLH18_13073 [Colletotrichum camelliae]